MFRGRTFFQLWAIRPWIRLGQSSRLNNPASLESNSDLSSAWAWEPKSLLWPIGEESKSWPCTASLESNPHLCTAGWRPHSFHWPSGGQGSQPRPCPASLESDPDPWQCCGLPAGETVFEPDGKGRDLPPMWGWASVKPVTGSTTRLST